MSLTVSVYYKDDEGRMAEPLKPRAWKGRRPSDDPEFMALSREEQTQKVLGPPEERGKDLAGWEVWRTKMYGSNVVRSFGLILLPLLAEGDIWAIGEDIDRLHHEAEVLLERVEQVAYETGTQAEDITFRVQNIKDAAIKAKAIDGGVVIW